MPWMSEGPQTFVQRIFLFSSFGGRSRKAFRDQGSTSKNLAATTATANHDMEEIANMAASDLLRGTPTSGKPPHVLPDCCPRSASKTIRDRQGGKADVDDDRLGGTGLQTLLSSQALPSVWLLERRTTTREPAHQTGGRSLHWYRLMGLVGAERYAMTADRGDDEQWLSTLHAPSSRGCPSRPLCNQTNPPETSGGRGRVVSQDGLGSGHQGPSTVSLSRPSDQGTERKRTSVAWREGRAATWGVQLGISGLKVQVCDSAL
ncbi:hypothetical protein B0T20DRAFT_388282 [Sordaria brevicollis]|uniref:Uncharacterized protein n=1 Tax=Sordaria brevicollis TaxID=83679 RepID=A0AAE0UFQ1_SORBR|nr:hypothetical protein B0T20DRAFT_388282 [Sordaria brevicollis]